MYGKQWGWTGNGNAYPGKPIGERELDARQDDADTFDLDDGEFDTDPATLPLPSMPSNCHGDVAIDAEDASALVCDYVNPPNDDDSNPPPPPPPPQRYAPGICSFHMKEYWTCSKDCYSTITMKDNAGTVIGSNEPAKGQLYMGQKIPYPFNSNLPMALLVATTNDGWDVEFKYSAASFLSTQKTQNDQGWCNVLDNRSGWTDDTGMCGGSADGGQSFQTRVCHSHSRGL